MTLKCNLLVKIATENGFVCYKLHYSQWSQNSSLAKSAGNYGLSLNDYNAMLKWMNYGMCFQGNEQNKNL